MTRVNQFAKDLGISRASALRLLNEARATNDKGKQVMNKYMKAEKGKSVKITGPAPRPKPGDLNESVGHDHEAAEEAQEREDKVEKHMKKAPKRSAKLKRRGDDEKVVTAKDGKYVRGMGKACMRDAKEVKIR
ncbi:MAG: hypothetical protein VXA34_00055 [Gammaproteobacteria bacterium]|jgi:hypothetical protein